MSAKRPELTPELLTRILPALRMMARFPSKPAKVVSFETSIELADIYAYTERRGRPDGLQIERLERDLKQILAGETRVETPPAAPATAVPPVATNTAPKNRRLADWVVVCRLLLENPTMSESAACRQHGVQQGSWSYFKEKRFGPGPIDRTKLSAFLQASGAAPAAPLAPAPAAGLAKVEVKPIRRGPPATARHTSRPADSARNTEIVAAIETIRRRFDDELNQLQKTATGVDRAILIARSKLEAASEIVTAIQGGGS